MKGVNILEKELIKLKGTIDGVKIYIDSESGISDIITSLYEKLRQFRKFFGDGHCNIYFVGRELTASDKMRLEAVVSAMLPESTVNYGERKKLREEKYIEQTLELPLDLSVEPAEEKENDSEESFREIKEVVTTNFKSSRARFYEGLVKSGKTVESDGHLILVGDVEEGGKITAVGNVVVMGSLKGSVEAGCMGNDNAYIIAMDFAPQEVRISRVLRKYTGDEESVRNTPVRAYIMDGMIYTAEFGVFSDI